MYPTDLTVAAVVDLDGRYLLVEEHAMGRKVLSQPMLRSPAVLRCVRDYLAGKRPSDTPLTGMLPLQHNVHRVLATADLV
jgi:hypothetical protein